MSAIKVSKIEATIRPMRSADLKRVLAMERRIFSDPWPMIAFKEHLSYGSAGGLVAESDGGIIGYACFRSEYGDIHLTNLAVAPDFRRKSVAKQLLARILAVAAQRNCEMIFLEVRASNRAARGFYEKAGFAVIDRSPGYYNSPVEDALIMSRRLMHNLDDR